MDRRSFIKNTGLIIGGTLTSQGCFGAKTNEEMQDVRISLAQWSLHRKFFDGELDAENFAAIARNSFEIEAVEYVNQFYTAQATNDQYWRQLRQTADDHDVRSLLIMIDDEGDLCSADDRERMTAVEQHKKWIDNAAILGCHSIRVNAFGTNDPAQFKAAAVDGMGALSAYAAQSNINVVIENHGLFSSDARLIASIVEEVNMSNFGTFPDFGNWCMAEKWGGISAGCANQFDIYQGVEIFMPYAKAVSAKSYDFDQAGNETTIDYIRMMRIVRDAGYQGYVGIEYEGTRLSEEEGIRATQSLIQSAWDATN